MSRTIILMLDSFGIGYAKDAEKFGDKGAFTLGHIADWCLKYPRSEGGEIKPLELPNMAKYGLIKAAQASTGSSFAHVVGDSVVPEAAYTYASEISHGKDTLSGHWELTGVPVLFDWGYFPNIPNCFPELLIERLIVEGGIPGVLGEKHASGTVIIQELGQEHCFSGKPIVYTSADSVLQIAAHEKYFGLQRLYDLCQVAYKLVQPYHIARVIARPFVGEKPGEYVRTGNRHDYAVPAPEATLLDRLVEKGGKVYAIGKIADIFAHRGITHGYHATGLEELFDTTMKVVAEAESGSLVFTNFVDFDSTYGHRRDVPGYAGGLEYIDKRLPDLAAVLREDDLVLITADHGCDPTWRGSDHTRENIPVLFWGPRVQPQQLRAMHTFSDAGQIVAHHMRIELTRGLLQSVMEREGEK